MRVIMLSLETGFFDPQGPAAERLRMYADRVESLDVFVPERRKQTAGAVHLASNVIVHPIPKGLKPLMVVQLIRVATVIGRTRCAEGIPCIVTSQDPFELGLAAYIVARKLRSPFHLQIHTDIGSPYFRNESLRRRVQIMIARFLIRRADAIRTVSLRVKKGIQAFGAAPDRIDVVPITTSWQELGQRAPATAFRQEHPGIDPLILIASRLSREKNISLAIRSFADVVKRYPDVGLLVIGEGREAKRLKQEAGAYGLTERVLFQGWSDDVISYMRSADIFLLPSDYEGWGMSVVEAAAAGLPVIMTDVGCAGEFLEHDVSGLVISVRDQRALTEAMLCLVGFPEERKRLAEGARKRLTMIQDMEAYEQAVIASYEHAIRNHETSHPHTKSR